MPIAMRCAGAAALLLAALGFVPPLQAAGEVLDAQPQSQSQSLLLQAVAAKATVVSGEGTETLSAVYIDAAGDCSFAALVHDGGSIENYSVCSRVPSQRSLASPAWPDNNASREFRERVIALALLYGSSAGIDPNGYTIRARITGAGSDACKIAEVSTMVDHALVRLDLLPACPR